MTSTTAAPLHALVPTGIPLSHLLAPGEAGSSASSRCPTALCGPIPASSLLHVAIGHNVSLSEYQRLQHLDLEEPLPLEEPMPVDVEAHPKYTWVISSSRSALHSKLAQEDDPFLRQHGGHPIIKEALNRVEFKYCTTSEQCLLLLQLLHAPSTGDTEPESVSRRTEEMVECPTLLIVWDMLRLFLEDDLGPDEEEDDEGGGGADMNMQVEGAERKVRLKEGVTLEDYMQLMACLRSTVSQVNPISPPTLLILEPSLPASGLTFPPPISSTRASYTRPGSTAGKKEGPSVNHALGWLFGEDQVWDIERSEESGKGSVERRGERGLGFRWAGKG